MLPASIEEIVDAFPCTYAYKKAHRHNQRATQMLYRDLRAVGAFKHATLIVSGKTFRMAMWMLPHQAEVSRGS